MTETDGLAVPFEQHRGHLRADTSAIENLKGGLTTVVARVRGKADVSAADVASQRQVVDEFLAALVNRRTRSFHSFAGPAT